MKVDVGWWPLDKVDETFVKAVNDDAKHYSNIEEPTDRVASKAEIEAKINEYKARHPTTKLKRISSMKYTVKVKLDTDQWTPEEVFDIGPDIWLAILGGS